MKNYIITIYDEGDHSLDRPIGEVEVRALDWRCASKIGELMFNNTGRVTSAAEIEEVITGDIMLTTNIELMKSEAARHVSTDLLVQGNYETCFIGCHGNGSNAPELLTEQYGLPLPVIRIAENIFEALPRQAAIGFHLGLPEAIDVDGKDLSQVVWQFFGQTLRDMPEQEHSIQAYIDPVIAGMELLTSGEEWPEAEAVLAAAVKAKNAIAAAIAAAVAAAMAAAIAAGEVEAAVIAAAIAAAMAAADAAVAAAIAAADAAVGESSRARVTLVAAEVVRFARASGVPLLSQRDLLLKLLREAPVQEGTE